MRLHRFYVEQPLGEEVVIDDVSIIKQWIKVFRYTESDLVILFNGEGLDVTYSITSVSSKECILRCVSSSPSYIPSKKVTLYLSLIKKDLFEFVVQKATELGVTTIVPIITERSLSKNLNLERLEIITKEASEQCFRGDVPLLSKAIPLEQALLGLPEKSLTIAFEKSGLSLENSSLRQKIHSASLADLFIGPEGGFSEKEIELFKNNNVTLASLGDTVLRAETAAIVATFSILR